VKQNTGDNRKGPLGKTQKRRRWQRKAKERRSASKKITAGRFAERESRGFSLRAMWEILRRKHPTFHMI
jgi:hypothetical protein